MILQVVDAKHCVVIRTAGSHFIYFSEKKNVMNEKDGNVMDELPAPT